MKRLTVIVLTLAMCLSMLAGCGNKKESTAVGNADYDVNEVVVKVGETEITMDEYRYYIIQAAVTELTARKPDFDGNFDAIDWNEKVDGDKTLSDVIKDRAIEDIKGTVAMVELGTKNGVSLGDAEKKQLETMLTQTKEQQGEEVFKLALRQMGMSSEENFKKVYNMTTLYSKVEEDIGANRDKYIDAELEAKLVAYKNDETVTAQHVLIMNESEKHSDPKAAIDEVLQRAKAGEDFNALMTEYNEDPGEGPGGYTFGKGKMVPEFEAASFALDYNQISDIVPSSYGYHVIKRIVGMAELKPYLLETTEVMVNNDAVATVSVGEIMAEVNKATEEINAQRGGKNNG